MSYKIIAVVGPTAVGKSDVGVRLAQLFDGEIINGDSIQVYRELNIGSAKVTEEEMGGIVHHLLDYKNVGDEYSVQHFQHDAREKIDEIAARAEELEKAIPEMDGTDDTILEAEMIRDALLPKMSELRIPCDEAETLTAKKYWPFPTYADLMFAGK